ncbi:MAG: WYL domain-containing protein [Deltaproteobacteria bacterium]|nr:WYL domain-containing protein [Deltaproteobacteria bacterium]
MKNLPFLRFLLILAISFLYRRSGKRYTVEPCKILYHGGFWYQVAMHDGIVKKFLLDFIEGIRATGRACGEIPESVRKTLSDAQSIWFQDKAPDRVTVEFDAEGAMARSRVPLGDAERTGEGEAPAGISPQPGVGITGPATKEGRRCLSSTLV